MAIVANELIWRRPSEVSDAGTNGGRMTMTAIPSAVKNNIWPDVPQSERTAGSTKYRKVFIHVANDNDLTLISPKVFVLMPTPGDDRVTFIPGTQTNLQSAVTGAEQKYGAGVLQSSVIATATQVVVTVEDWADTPIFADGMKIRISDKQSIGGAGNEEYATITGAPGVSGNNITLNLTAGLANGYSNATPTYVSSVYEPGDVECSSVWGTETTTLGTYDEVTYPPVCDNLGTIEQTWTLTFTSSTAFTASGNTVGAITAGATTTPYSPVNSVTGKPYFTLSNLGFGGTWATNDTITFTTHPASIPLWYQRVIDPGANSLSGNKVIVAVDGESA